MSSIDLPILSLTPVPPPETRAPGLYPEPPAPPQTAPHDLGEVVVPVPTLKTAFEDEPKLERVRPRGPIEPTPPLPRP